MKRKLRLAMFGHSRFETGRWELDSTDLVLTPGARSDGYGLRYALITPAKNEVLFIEKTIRSVVAQTSLPVRWIIVSDGSTDGTDDIVKGYAGRFKWIELLRMPPRTDR